MNILGKGVAFFLLFCGSLMTSQLARASSFETLNWLPLLTASMKSFQPDILCPNNKINDLKVEKQNVKIITTIREVNWDINCNKSEQESPALSDKQKTEQIDLLLTQLSQLPAFKINLKTINIVTSLLKTEYSSKLSVDKSNSQVSVKIKSELVTALLTLNLRSKKLNVDAKLNLDKLPTYLHTTTEQDRYLKNSAVFNYQGDLNKWFNGQFKLDWQGAIEGVSNDVALSVVGELNLLSERLTLSKLSINAKKITLLLSETQSWKTAYIKLKNSEDISLNFAQLNIKALPLELRIGSSRLFTKVERGKSKRIRIDKQKLPSVYLQLAARGAMDNLLVEWRLALLNQTLKGEVSVTPALIKLQMADNNIKLASLLKAASKYVEGLDLFVIQKGVIQQDLLAEYDRIKQTITLESSLNSSEIAGERDKVLFDGVYFSSQLHYVIDEQKNITAHQDEQQLKIANLFVGVPIQALQLDAQVVAGKPVVQHFKARLLGGRVDFDDFKLSAPSQTILNISGVDLAEVIKYTAYPEIDIKGIVDGMLPLTLKKQGPEILDGIIFARPPGGFIKVPESTTTEAMGSRNPALSLTLQILSNLQFNTMQGKIGYTSDGESDFKVEIKGISPKVTGTQPINFNYSHNENILKLLKSLRFNEELVRDIKERY